MKRTLNSLLILVAAISFNVNAALLTGSLGTYDTGIVSTDDIAAQSGAAGGFNIDPIIAYTFLSSSGDKTEIDWLTAAYGYLDIYDAVPSISKIELDTDADSDAYWTDLSEYDSNGDVIGDSIYTGDLNYGNDNYLLKIGQGQKGEEPLDYNTFLYSNLDSLFQATINLGTLATFSGFEGTNFDIYRVSHISEVPVPAAIWLFGTGLIGLVGFSKRRKGSLISKVA